MQKLNEKQMLSVSGGHGCFCTCFQHGAPTHVIDGTCPSEQACQTKCTSLGYDGSLCTRTPNAPVKPRPVADGWQFNNDVSRILQFS